MGVDLSVFTVFHTYISGVLAEEDIGGFSDYKFEFNITVTEQEIRDVSYICLYYYGDGGR